MMQLPDDLGALVGYRLKETQSVLRARMDEVLREIGLTTPQYICLELLSRNPGWSNAELARGAFVTRQTMNTLMQTLQSRGLITRATQARTGRALPTTLTAHGEELLHRATSRISEIERRMVSLLDDEQTRALHEGLTRCIEALSSESSTVSTEH
ncbi:MarR family winged helix-turn-helix transcriptional regulator [Microbacterium sp. MPKO10]|uniref:MarR family winged helix-turn-helix transcriptional regulator n=1 Tax=Microbacterium sp. MPKO10 TaxID=2989818 RepID=UPI002236A957|nr:MarR family transcriptional regulator [Microbacterium sp. MPKO10]MCW4457730.1 MarR family transcriptional regulator [Microbacterium sp. MPKO10]